MAPVRNVKYILKNKKFWFANLNGPEHL